jgi:hypothetical protein
LKFNRSFEKTGRWRSDMSYRVITLKRPLLARFLIKLVDVLPAALASAIAGFLFTHYQSWHVAAPEPSAQVAPASAEMMQLLRDEHGLILSYLKAQRASETQRLAAEDAAPRVAVAAAEPAAVAAPQKPDAAAALWAKAVSLRSKSPVTGAPLPPLVIAQAQQNPSKPATDSDSLFAKTIGIKEHVVAVTHHVVSVIGGIPSWIGSIGDRIGGEGATPRPPADVVSAS